MSNIDKQALRQTAEKAQEHGVFNMDIHSQTVLALLDELEAKDSTIATQQQEIRTLLNALGQASEKRNAEQAGIIAKQEKWIKDVEETMISATDRAEAAEKRIAELEATQGKPVMFIDGDISPADADKLAAVIREFNEETETPAARMARIIRENPHPTNMCDMPAAAAGKGE